MGGTRHPNLRPLVALTPIVVTVVLVAAAVATGAAWRHAEDAAAEKQRVQSSILAGDLDAAVTAASARLTDLAGAVTVSPDPRYGAFGVLAERIREQTAFVTLAYLAHVPRGQEEAFFRRHGAPIVELTPESRLTPRLPRDVHYPSVAFDGPHLGTPDVGVDSVSRVPWIRAAFARARTTRTVAATLPIRLPEPLGYGTALVAPAGRGGYVAGMLPYDDIVGQLAERVPGARFLVRDGRIGIGGQPGSWRAPHVRQVAVGGRHWTVVVDRPRADLGVTLAIGAVGLLFAIVVGLAGQLTVRRQRVVDAARRAAEKRSRDLAQTSTDLLLIHGRDGRIAYASPASRELLGLPPEKLVGRAPQGFVHPDDLPRVVAALEAAAGDADTLALTVRLRRADGGWVWAEIRSRVLRDPEGRPAETHSTVRDVSEQMAASAALEDAESLFRSTFEEAPIGMAITAVDGRFRRVNHAFGAMLGYAPEAIEGAHVNTFTHPDDIRVGMEGTRRMLDGETDGLRLDKRYLHASGAVVWASVSICAVRDADGDVRFFLAQMQDITERRRQEAELRHLADHDPLTGLLNRRSFERELERQLAAVERYGARGAAMVLDLDHFKTINDTLGHAAGDGLIGQVAQALRGRLRESDVLARLGGDEFAVLLPEGDRDDAVAVAEGVLDVIRGQAVTASSGRARRVTASLGIALFEGDRRLTPDAVLVAADLAMYEAKEAGRDRYAVADAAALEGGVGTGISWADVIRDALAEDRFVLHAQPIVDVDSGAIGQYELLLRMIDPDGRLIMPGAFLPVAERYDLIGEIDAWVVRRAIAMLAATSAAGHRLTVEVNLSGRSTGDPQLLALIEHELHETGVDPGQLIFEITETTAVSNIPAAQQFAARLAELGCRFALDDFGAGFGSFYYLKHLPFDYLKIDGEFVRHCASNRTDQLVIGAVVDIARGLGKRTVAEQAGDDATLDFLRRMGVDQAQGYFLGRPAPLDEWLERAGTHPTAV